MQVGQVGVFDVGVLLFQVVPEFHRDVCPIVAFGAVVHLHPLVFAGVQNVLADILGTVRPVVTPGAPVGLLSRVNTLVSRQVGLGCGGEVTLVTFERLLPCVLPAVLGQGVPRATRKATEVTQERLLACVCPVVVFHGGGREEGVVARGPGAPERLLPRVEFHVVVQGPLLCETSVTQVAGELPFFWGANSMFA